MNRPAMVHITYIRTTPDKLWEALTSAAFTTQYWFGRRIEADWRPGSPVRFYDSADDSLADSGEVLTYDRPRALAYTFKNEFLPEMADDKPGRVTFTIEPAGDDVVKLEVVHDQLTEDRVEYFRRGWAPILANLKTYLESGTVLMSSIDPAAVGATPS